VNRESGESVTEVCEVNKVFSGRQTATSRHNCLDAAVCLPEETLSSSVAVKTAGVCEVSLLM
jgi:hypothetical protein